ncbi:hypothetical protein INR49_022335 [Caranx melampygus]|nr:hypothetical protein INR49_022335 [Caranx melampygus]
MSSNVIFCQRNVSHPQRVANWTGQRNGVMSAIRVSSGKSGSISATPSPSSIGCSSSDTWQRPTEQPQASCQLQNIHCSKQGQSYRAP